MFNKIASLSAIHPGFKNTSNYDEGNKAHYNREYAGNVVKTAVLGTGVAGAAVAASILAKKSEPQIGKLKSGISAPFANLIKPDSKIGKFFATLKKPASDLASSELKSEKALGLLKKPFAAASEFVRNIKFLNTGMEQVRKGKEAVTKFVGNMPKPVKIAAAVLGALVVVDHIYRIGKLDKESDDFVASVAKK